MSLLRLPPETLAQIFDHISSSFFREDLGRLTVCKQWLEFALTACFKSITLSQENLRGLIVSRVVKRPSPLERSLEILNLELWGCDHFYGSAPDSRGNSPVSDAVNASVSNETASDIPVDTHHIDILDNDVTQLATIAQQSRRLRSLNIRAWSPPSVDAFDVPEDYLSLSSIRGFLSVENLSVLVLDLPINFLNSPREQEEEGAKEEKGFHICPAIGALLRTLRTLHLRMSRICPAVLKPRDSDDSLNLSTVIVNLSLITDLPSAAHSKRCGSSPTGGLLRLKADMREQAEALASRMASPKMVRVLTHSLPHFEMQSLDVLTGKTMTLNDDMDWDEDGETVVVEDSEPESDFSSFSDE